MAGYVPVPHAASSYCSQTAEGCTTYVFGHNYAAFVGVAVCLLLLIVWSKYVKTQPEEPNA